MKFISHGFYALVNDKMEEVCKAISTIVLLNQALRKQTAWWNKPMASSSQIPFSESGMPAKKQ